MQSDFLKTHRSKWLALFLACAFFMTGFPAVAYGADGGEEVRVTEQQLNITGTVRDGSGEPVIGASIVEMGTSNGTITDLDGNFILSVGPGAVLQVSYIGFKTQEVAVSGSRPIHVTLLEDSELLDEVVVIGYGAVQRKNFTGSVSQVKMSDSPLALMPSTNPLDALRGTVSGIAVAQQQGAGQSPGILVRGQKSIKATSTDPLIVLDGVIFMGSMRDIDQSIVESMSVLKDATSVASYGSRAANGVIMITTKKGKVGKPVVNFNTSVGVSHMANKPKMLSPENYIKKINLLQGLDENADPTWMKEFERENYLNGTPTDWVDFVSRTGVMQNYSASVSGATEKTNYFISASHADHKGVLIGDDYNRQAFNARVQTDITSWLQIGADASYSFNDYSGVTSYNIGNAIMITPWGRPYRDSENKLLEKYPREEGTVYIKNPLWDIKSGTVDDLDTYSTYMVKGHALIKCPWIKGLSYRMNFSYSNEYIVRDIFYHEGYYVGIVGSADDRYAESTLRGYLSEANGESARTKNTSWVMDNIVNYSRQLGKHFIDLTYVYTRDSYVYDYRKFTGKDFTELGNTELGYNGLTYAAIQQITNIDYTKKNNIGYLGRVNYNYDDKYHFTASVRRDGSSVFGADKKWGVFPSVGVAWTVTNEDFMEVKEIDYLKVKASWGKNGNQSISPYGTLSTITLGQKGGLPYLFGNGEVKDVSWGQRISSIGNSELAWETTTAFNVGFELGMFDNRVHLDFDSYISKTTDQIFSRTLPVMTSSVTSMSATMGQVNNWGIEATLSTTNIKTRDFRWDSSLIFYMNRNKLKELYGDGNDDISNNLFLGKSLGAIYGYKVIGIVQEDDYDYIEKNNAQPGDAKFYDVDGDGYINADDDRMILGYDKENFRMGFSNTLQYKDFELYLLFTGIFGGNGYYMASNKYAYQTYTGEAYDNSLDHGWWTAENRSNKYPRVNYSDSRYNPVQCKGFVRLQDISLSYTFRQPWVKKINISSLKVYAAAKNLITFTGWTGGDPEIAQTLSGRDYGYPLATSYSFGLNLTF